MKDRKLLFTESPLAKFKTQEERLENCFQVSTFCGDQVDKILGVISGFIVALCCRYRHYQREFAQKS